MVAPSSLSIRLFWAYSNLPMSEYAHRISRTLNLLSTALPEFRHFYQQAHSKEQALALPVSPGDVPRIEALVNAGLITGGTGHKLGYRFSLWSGGEDGPAVCFDVESSRRVNGLLLEQIPTPKILRDRDAASAFLLELVSIWSPLWASIYIPSRVRCADHTIQPVVLGPTPQVGWVTYLSRDLPIVLRLRVLALHRTRVPVGSMVFASPECPDPDDLGQFKSMRKLARVLGCEVAW